MKRIVTLLLAAGLVLGAAGAGQAADIKVKGVWDFNFEWSNTNFRKDNNDADYFGARQRLRTQIDVIASESLKGVLFLEIGDQNWGKASQGGSIGTDGTVIEVRYSYVDWVVPNTDLKVRMGLQPIILPSFVIGTQVLNHDAAALSLAYSFNEVVSTNLFWARLENDNYDTAGISGSTDHKFKSDAFDVFGLTVPLTFDGVKVTPWGAYAAIGRNSLASTSSTDQIRQLRYGMTPLGSGQTFATSNDASGNAWWLGLTGEVTLWNPFRLAWDFNYGSADMGTGTIPAAAVTAASLASNKLDLERKGWIASMMAEYKLDMMTPGLIMWYGSGDDSNLNDGSERMPTMNGAFGATSYGFANAAGLGATDTMIGDDVTGTWGIIARLKDITFMEDLSHTLAIGYYRGTNNKQMAKYTVPYRQLTAVNSSMGVQNATYLTTKDSAWEVNFDTKYDIYEDLTLFVELGYLHLGLDSDVWSKAIIDNTNKNNFKAGVNLQYRF